MLTVSGLYSQTATTRSRSRREIASKVPASFCAPGQHIVPHDGRFPERFDFLCEAVDVIDGDAGAGKAALTAFRALAETPHFIASEMQIAALRMHFGGLFNERGGQLKRALAQRAQFTGCVRNFPQVFVLREFQRVFQMPKTLLERDHVNEVIVRGLKQLIELFPRQCIERVAELPALARAACPRTRSQACSV